MKKLFIISTILFSIILIFLGIYNFVFKKNLQINPSDTVKQKSQNNNDLFINEKAISQKNNSKISIISEQAAKGLYIDKKREKIKYYAAEDGTIWESDLDGKNLKQIENTQIIGFKNAQWSVDGKKTISQLEKDGKISWFEFDHEKMAGIQLKDGIDYAVWDNRGTKIIYKYYDNKTKKRSLNISDFNGSNWKILVEDIPYRDVIVMQIPQTSLISFWNKPDSKEETKLQTVSEIGGGVNTILAGKYGADHLWSNDGKKVLISSLETKSGKKLTLGILNFITVGSQQDVQDLGIPTFVSKIVWSKDEKTLYYALPGSIPENAVLPEEYAQMNFMTGDTFWKVNTETGEKTRIIEPDELKNSIDAQNLMLTPKEDALIFINRRDGKINRINL